MAQPTTKVFFAFPYDFGESHRVALKEGAQLAGVEAVFADERLRPTHILNNVSICIDETDAGFYDITGHNENVLIEFGIGYGSGKPSFLIVNEVEHVAPAKRFTPRQTLPTPSDLQGIVQIRYSDTSQLRMKLRDAIRQHVLQRPHSEEGLAQSILHHLSHSGPSTIARIAEGVTKPIDEVRPALQYLLKTDQIVKEGHARSTRYLLPSQSKQPNLI